MGDTEIEEIFCSENAGNYPEFINSENNIENECELTKRCNNVASSKHDTRDGQEN